MDFTTGTGSLCALGVAVHDGAHGFKGGVYIGVERDGHVGVAEDAGESGGIAAQVHAVGGKGVPLWHNKDKSESP